MALDARPGGHRHRMLRTGSNLGAALHVTTGKVIGQCMSRQRYREWLRFLRRIDAETPRHLDVHLITDSYATHKHAWVSASAVPHAEHPDLDAAPTRTPIRGR